MTPTRAEQSKTPIQTRWYRQGYQDGVREAEARTIEQCAQVVEKCNYWPPSPKQLAAAIRALKEKT